MGSKKSRKAGPGSLLGRIGLTALPLLLFGVRPTQQVEVGAGGGSLEFTHRCGGRELHEMVWLTGSYDLFLLGECLRLGMDLSYVSDRFRYFYDDAGSSQIQKQYRSHRFGLLPRLDFDFRYLGIGLGGIFILDRPWRDYHLAFPSLRLRLGPRLFNFW